MRLLEFVPCGRRPVSLPEEEKPPASPANSGGPSEKRRRRVGSGSAAAVAWRPSLGSISEDGVASATAVVNGGDRIRAGGSGSGKARGKPVARIVRAQREDYRHLGVPAMVPAFAPAAFLF